ncbi:MAG: Amidase [Parcubacteria group bacterium GW2011_GWC2_39_14]|nr:MAG: Amidase [Parcubacteria group bacterium GW2011_GWC2_39_14]KKR54800.1 MAG: Amidase [Parcubacteria group bacterium GW2011_GWA2_40_23]
MKKIVVFAFLCLFIFPFQASLATVDLGLKPTSVRFADNNENFISGAKERIYVAVANYGTEDASGTVIFYRDVQIIGEKPVSIPAQSFEDEVFVDFIVPDHPFRIYFELKGIDPADNNESNNQLLAALYDVDVDTDRDGIGNKVDDDDDSDGLKDIAEDSIGTDPLKWDTDGDGVNDLLDAFPLDPTKSKKEAPKVEPPKVEPPKEVKKEAPAQTKAPVKETVPVTKPAATTETKDPDIGKKEIVSDFYQSAQVTLLNQINIHAQQVNWNTFDFSFSTNLPDLDTKNLQFVWTYGDGSEGTVNGQHTFKKTGDYYATLKVKGPWDSYFYDNVKVTVDFWSVYNYWLWLFVLAIALAVVLFGTSFKHCDRTIVEEERTIAKRIKKEPKNKKES